MSIVHTDVPPVRVARWALIEWAVTKGGWRRTHWGIERPEEPRVLTELDGRSCVIRSVGLTVGDGAIVNKDGTAIESDVITVARRSGVSLDQLGREVCAIESRFAP